MEVSAIVSIIIWASIVTWNVWDIIKLQKRVEKLENK